MGTRGTAVRMLAVAVLAAGGGAPVAGTGAPGPARAAGPAKQAERLNRGLVSVHSRTRNPVSWRLLRTHPTNLAFTRYRGGPSLTPGPDPTNVAFTVYRGGTRLTASPLTGATDYLDTGAAAGASYTVRAVVNGAEQAASEPSLSFANGFLDVPIQPPSGGTTPDGVA